MIRLDIAMFHFILSQVWLPFTSLLFASKWSSFSDLLPEQRRCIFSVSFSSCPPRTSPARWPANRSCGHAPTRSSSSWERNYMSKKETRGGKDSKKKKILSFFCLPCLRGLPGEISSPSDARWCFQVSRILRQTSWRPGTLGSSLCRSSKFLLTSSSHCVTERERKKKLKWSGS